MLVNEVLHGDARILLPELAATGYGEGFRLAYADPPFNTRRSDRGPFRDQRTAAEWADLIKDVAAGVMPLLSQDGSFWLHVNDRQLGAAQGACDAVFGHEHFVGTISWERTRRPSYLPGQPLASTTDFILIYAKDPRSLRPFTAGTTEAGKRVPIAHRGNPITRLQFPIGAVRFTCADGLYQAGDHSTSGIDVRLTEDVRVNDGRNTTPLSLTLPSRYSQATVHGMLNEGAEFLIPRRPFRPSYLSPGGKPKAVSNIWSWRLDDNMPTNEDAYKEQLLAGMSPFPFAKPVGLLTRILEVATEPDDVVLDPFAGSGTTALAAVRTGRKYVLIEEHNSTIKNFIQPRLIGSRGNGPETGQ
ncbi:site-specific DNA-methyltransferase [Arthrobacter flavus]|uniref:DNA methyltransferase n=1 Tax=Arthrobacter flavus TaxID=95172 RepID=A0ABW4QA31_9MICC